MDTQFAIAVLSFLTSHAVRRVHCRGIRVIPTHPVHALRPPGFTGKIARLLVGEGDKERMIVKPHRWLHDLSIIMVRV